MLHKDILSPLGKVVKEVTQRPLEKYTFKNLQKISFPPSTITLGHTLKDDDPDFVSQMFYFTFEGKKVSGLINVPTTPGTYPVLIMFRGFVDRGQFTTGEGTRRTAEEFARNGFITLAPDFLGYGASDREADDGFESRFQTYTTGLVLLASVEKLQDGLNASYSGKLKVDTTKVGVWGHSNGGHIALSVLAISGKKYPTVLWNPVTKPFPYSILYFTDEYDDGGKALRKSLANFEALYNTDFYDPSRYYDWIQASIQLHQAVDDEEVPLRWSDQFVEHMKSMDKDMSYFIYPGENHNFNNGSWPTIMQRSIEFLDSQFSHGGVISN